LKYILADRTNGRAIGTVLRLSVVVCRLLHYITLHKNFF